MPSEILAVEQLYELEELLGRAALSGLLNRFSETLVETRRDLSSALDAGDPARIRKIAHRTAGVCAQFAAPGVAHLAARVEAEPQDADAVRELLRGQDGLVQAMRAYVASTLQ